MLDIAFVRPSLPKSGALVLLAHEGEKPSGLWQQADEATGGAIARGLDVAGLMASMSFCDRTLAPGAGLPRVIVIGLGKPAEVQSRVSCKTRHIGLSFSSGDADAAIAPGMLS